MGIMYSILIIMNIISTVLFIMFLCYVLTNQNKKNNIFYCVMNAMIISFIQCLGTLLNWKDTKDSNLYYGEEYGILCQSQGMLLITTTVSLELWTTIIVILLYLKLMRQKKKSSNPKKKYHLICFHLLSYIFPIFLTSFIKYNDAIGANHHFCFVKSEKRRFILYFFIVKWIIITTSTISTILLIRRIRKSNNLEKEDINKFNKNKRSALTFIIFPLFQIFDFFPGTIYRIVNIFYPDFTYLAFIHVISVGSSSIVYVCFYGRQIGMFNYYKEKICKGKKEDMDISFDKRYLDSITRDNSNLITNNGK